MVQTSDGIAQGKDASRPCPGGPLLNGLLIALVATVGRKCAGLRARRWWLREGMNLPKGGSGVSARAPGVWFTVRVLGEWYPKMSHPPRQRMIGGSGIKCFSSMSRVSRKEDPPHPPPGSWRGPSPRSLLECRDPVCNFNSRYGCLVGGCRKRVTGASGGCRYLEATA